MISLSGVRVFQCEGSSFYDPLRESLRKRGWIENRDLSALFCDLVWLAKSDAGTTEW